MVPDSILRWYCRLLLPFSLGVVNFLFGGTRLVALPEPGRSPSLSADLTSRFSASEATERMDALRREIAYHDELYFKKAAPVVSDGAYDQLKRELAGLELAFPRAAREGNSVPDQIADDRTDGFSSSRHRVRMLSLNKSYTEGELRAFDTRLSQQLGRRELEYVVEPKFDGLAISVTFEKGRLARAVTRGNGVEGDDVTANVLTIRNLPRTLRPLTLEGAANPIPEVIELRGEIYLSFAEFDRINRERESAGEMPFSIPRNLAAGTLKQLDPAEVAKRQLEIVFYGVGACEPAPTRPGTQLKLIHQLRDWGLPTINEPRLAHGFVAVWQAVQAVGRGRSRLGFPIDGAVVKVNAAALQDQLGVSPQAPLWAMAYKFVPEQIETVVRSITLQVGRSGVITPVAELAPVKLGGATITRASLFNADEIRRRDIRVGDYVFVEKAGEIIPAIANVDRSKRTPAIQPFVFPSTCPACRAALMQAPGESAIRCPNPECPEQIKRRIEHFASAQAVNISGLGPAMVDKLVRKGLVKTIADLYRLRREDLLLIDSVGGKSADRLLASIERSKHAELWRFILGLGIPEVGQVTAQRLANRFQTLDNLMRAQRNDFSQEDGKVISGIGESASQAVLNYLLVEQNQMLLKSLSAVGKTSKL